MLYTRDIGINVGHTGILCYFDMLKGKGIIARDLLVDGGNCCYYLF